MDARAFQRQPYAAGRVLEVSNGNDLRPEIVNLDQTLHIVLESGLSWTVSRFLQLLDERLSLHPARYPRRRFHLVQVRLELLDECAGKF